MTAGRLHLGPRHLPAGRQFVGEVQVLHDQGVRLGRVRAPEDQQVRAEEILQRRRGSGNSEDVREPRQGQAPLQEVTTTVAAQGDLRAREDRSRADPGHLLAQQSALKKFTPLVAQSRMCQAHCKRV